VAVLSTGTLPTAVGGREGNHLRKGPGACCSKERGDGERGSIKDPSVWGWRCRVSCSEKEIFYSPLQLKADLPINSSLDGAQSRRRKRKQALSGEMGLSAASSREAAPERGLHPPTGARVLSCPSSSS